MEKIAEDMREYRRSQEEMLKRQVCCLICLYVLFASSYDIHSRFLICIEIVLLVLINRRKKQKQRT